jgi:phosphoribosyl-ATP pyrophosphohydrolase/phosphoribosyl-AMP cyclohydrolase
VTGAGGGTAAAAPDRDSATLLDPDAVAWGADGLIAAIVQDAADGRVLMVAWQDREALEATLSTREVHFHSRSRGTLWRKGETSGNVLHLVSAQLDCDADAILLTVHPVGPACHTGARSCFDVGAATAAAHQVTAETQAAAPRPDAAVARSDQGFDWLEELWATIQQRAQDRPTGSYTAKLLAGGVDAVARKVAEEAVEVVMAAKDDASSERAGASRDRSALTGEFADLLYHSLVLMAERGLAPADVIKQLRDRHSAP